MNLIKINDKFIEKINESFDEILFYESSKLYAKLNFKFNHKKTNKILELKQMIENKPTQNKLIIMPIGNTDIIGIDYRFYFQDLSYLSKTSYIFIGSKNNVEFIHTHNFLFTKFQYKEIILPMSLNSIELNVYLKIDEFITRN